MNLVAAYTAGRLLAELDWRLQQACLAPRPEENVVHDVFGRFSLEGRRVVAGHPDQVVLEDAIHRGWATLNSRCWKSLWVMLLSDPSVDRGGDLVCLLCPWSRFGFDGLTQRTSQ